MKKLGIILLVLLLCQNTFALAARPILIATEDNLQVWLNFDAEDNVSFYPSSEERTNPIPAGLESMYRWLEQIGSMDTIMFVQMPFGRVLTSSSIYPIDAPLSAEKLCALWPQAAEDLAKTTLYFNDSMDCVNIVTWRGQDWMAVETTATLDGEDMLSIDMTGLFNCDDGFLQEVWIVQPSPATYLYDDAAKKELEADTLSAEEWLKTLYFPSEEISQAQLLQINASEGDDTDTTPLPQVAPEPPQRKAERPPVPTTDTARDVHLPIVRPSNNKIKYEDPLGRFSLTMPDNLIVILPEQAQEKLASAKEDLGDSPNLPLYRHWLTEAEANHATLFTDPGYQGALLLMIGDAGSLKSTEDIADLAPAIEKYLSQSITELTTEDAELSTLNDILQYVFLYGGKYEEQDVSLLVLASVEGTALRETNLWYAETDLERIWPEAMVEILYTIEYTANPTGILP